MNDVAKNIKKTRTNAGMTQEELAEKMFVTRQTISNWETGKSQPDIETLSSLANVFGLDEMELLYGRKSSYQKYQKKYIVVAIISFCVVIAAILSEILLVPYLKMQVSIAGDASKMMFYIYWMRPFFFLALGFFVLSISSFWVDLRLEKRIRIITLIIGIVMLLASFSLAIITYVAKLAPQIGSAPIVTSLFSSIFLPILVSEFLSMILLSIMPILAGGALFLGFNRKTETERRHFRVSRAPEQSSL